jgi:hypothetical protein
VSTLEKGRWDLSNRPPVISQSPFVRFDFSLQRNRAVTFRPFACCEPNSDLHVPCATALVRHNDVVLSRDADSGGSKLDRRRLNTRRSRWHYRRQNDRFRKRFLRRTGEKPPLGTRRVSTRFRADALKLIITLAAEHIEDLLPRSKLGARKKNRTGFARFLIGQEAVDLNKVEFAPRGHDAPHGSREKGMPGVLAVEVRGSHGAIIDAFDNHGQLHCIF